jgi:hypothetical protein
MTTNPPNRRRRPLLGRLALVLGTALFTLVLCEVAARVFSWRQEVRAMEAWQKVCEQKLKPPTEDENTLGNIIRLAQNPRIVYELIPNLKFRYKGVECRTDSFGFRGPGVAVHKPPGVFRVVVIGDSVAFGHGVAENDAFPYQLGAMLTGIRGGKPVEVIDTAVPGYNTAMEVETLVDKGLAFEPDLVVCHFVGNDCDLPNFIALPQDFLTLSHSFLLEQMARAWEPRDPWRDRPWGNAPQKDGRFVCDESLPPVYRDMVGPEMFRRELQRLKDLSQQHHFAVVVSEHWDKDLPAPTEGVVSVGEICRQIGLPCAEADLKVRAWLQAHGIPQEKYIGSELTISQRDPHPRAPVHRMIAESIVELLRADDLLPQ